jgi:hypothetical protein
MNAKKGSKIPALGELFSVSFCVLCTEAILGSDGSISLIKIIDQVDAPALPVMMLGFNFVADLTRNQGFTIQQALAAKPVFGIRMRNPVGEEINFGDYAPEPQISEIQEWHHHRMALNLSGRMALLHAGTYKFMLFGKILENEFEKLSETDLIVRVVSSLPMQGAAFAMMELKKSQSPVPPKSKSRKR